jgi:hypothetical protein
MSKINWTCRASELDLLQELLNIEDVPVGAWSAAEIDAYSEDVC